MKITLYTKYFAILLKNLYYNRKFTDLISTEVINMENFYDKPKPECDHKYKSKLDRAGNHLYCGCGWHLYNGKEYTKKEWYDEFQDMKNFPEIKGVKNEL
jgi:hypothetical protein